MSFPFRQALVTGGAGFIGSHLAEELVASGCRVVVLDNLASGNLDNLESIRNDIRFVHGDIRDLPTVENASRDCEVIFHLAAVVSVPQTVEQPVESALVNELGTLHVFEAARKNGAGSIVFASSSAVYGDDPDEPTKHEALRPKPLSPYAAQKITGEYYAHIYNNLYGLKAVCLRFFNVFGPRQDPSSPYSGVISIFMSKAACSEPPTIFGDGTQCRDFIYVEDVVQANLVAAASQAAAGQSLNVASGQSVTINQLWDRIRQMGGLKIDPQYAPPRPGDIHTSVADNTRAELLMGFSPHYSFEEGLEHTYKWFRESQSGQAGIED
jgi:UDP-glucose 4-epimerase